MFRKSGKFCYLKTQLDKSRCWRRKHGLALACPGVIRRPCIQDMCSVDPDCPQPKVVIIGAGLAGLSAAHRLISCGLNRVVILEAQDRTGGRIYTKKLGDVTVDFGATWINGACTGNPAFSLACQDGAIQSPMVRSARNECFCFDSSGNYIKPKVFESASKLFHDIRRTAKIMYRTAPESMDLWTYFTKEIQGTIDVFPVTDRVAARKVMYGLTNEVRHCHGTGLDCIPLNRFGRLKLYPGGAVAVMDGMSRILNPLLRVVTEDRIKYNRVATKIIWMPKASFESRVAVISGDGKIEKADYIIVTVPLGVLKASHENMFDPPLPEYKAEAIKALGFGHSSTVILKYKKPFWIKGEGYIRLCWSKEELEDRDHWSKGVSIIEEIPTTEDMLFLKISGPEAVEVECMSDCEVATQVTSLIHRFLGNTTIPLPEKVFRAPWKNNSFFGGSKTFIGFDAHEKDIAKLGKPLGFDNAPTLFFAGEACMVQQMDLPAARLSGIIEAEKILNLTKCFCGPPPLIGVTCD